MRDQHNIIAAAELKPDIMGFIFYQSSPRYAGEVLNRGPYFRPSSRRNIQNRSLCECDYSLDTVILFRKYSLDMVQLHGDEPPELCSRIKDTGTGVIKAFNVDEE